MLVRKVESGVELPLSPKESRPAPSFRRGAALDTGHLDLSGGKRAAVSAEARISQRVFAIRTAEILGGAFNVGFHAGVIAKGAKVPGNATRVAPACMP
jgi:hypothetical protein